MKQTKLLLPYRCKKFGIASLALGLVMLVALATAKVEFSYNSIRGIFGLEKLELVTNNFSEWDANTDLSYTLACILVIIGAVLTGFSECRNEDEFTGKMRLDALILSFYLHAGVLLLAYLLTWRITFMCVALFDTMAALLFYVAVFHIKLFVEKKKMRNEE